MSLNLHGRHPARARKPIAKSAAGRPPGKGGGPQPLAN